MKKKKDLDLGRLARNDFERAIARIIAGQEQYLEILDLCANEAEKEFAFRCLLVPLGVWPEYSSGEGLRVLDANFYVMAHSRMLRETLLYGTKSPHASQDDAERVARSEYWLNRFDRWLLSIRDSFCLLVRKKCIAAEHPNEDIGHAAVWGTINNLFGIRSGLKCELLSRLERQVPARAAEKVFYEYSFKPVSARWDYPELDMWLTEIWPLVESCHWTYRDVWKLAVSKFDSPEEPVYDRVGTFASHCKMLGLRISDVAQARGGRPSNEEEIDENYPPHAKLALSIDPILHVLTKTSKEPLDVCYDLGYAAISDHSKIT